MHIITCSNFLDSKRIIAVRTEVNEKKIFFCKFSNKFSCKLSILLVQNISVLDKPTKLVSCVRVDYENKTQMLLNPSIQFFIGAQGVIRELKQTDAAAANLQISIQRTQGQVNSVGP